MQQINKYDRYKVGQMVQLISSYGLGGPSVGAVGEIVVIDETMVDGVLVEWQNFTRGHDGIKYKYAKYGVRNRWWVPPELIIIDKRYVLREILDKTNDTKEG